MIVVSVSLSHSGPEPGVMRLPSFTTELGARLAGVEVAFECFGTLHPDGSNAILVCHALTGDAHVGDGPDRPGWWGPLIGPGRALDTDGSFIVCANVIGGCAGSTGPASLDPATGRPYGPDFPPVTIRDMVVAQYLLAGRLGVKRWRLVTGGSMGGMQALEWAVMYPDFCEQVCVMAAPPAFDAMSLAYNQVMREAIVSDPDFCGGRYVERGTFPAAGLRIARMLGMITYRTARQFEERFGRKSVPDDPFDFQVGRYLRHHGDKLVARFDANAYLTLMRAMDLHDIGRGRGGERQAWERVRGRVTFVGIDDDLLYPPAALRDSVRRARAVGVDAHYEHIVSQAGHDAFLLEFDQLDRLLRRLQSNEEREPV